MIFSVKENVVAVVGKRNIKNYNGPLYEIMMIKAKDYDKYSDIYIHFHIQSNISTNNLVFFRTTYSDDIALLKLDTSEHGEPNIPEEIELQSEPIAISEDLGKVFKNL